MLDLKKTSDRLYNHHSYQLVNIIHIHNVYFKYQVFVCSSVGEGRSIN